MAEVTKLILKKLHDLYIKTVGIKPETTVSEDNADKVALTIYEALTKNEPLMIARFGAFELGILNNYIGVQQGNKNILSYIRGETKNWWWDKTLIGFLNTNAGFFPISMDKIEQFCRLMIKEIPEVDILGSWLSDENVFKNELIKAQRVNLELLNPYFSKIPWTKALEGKKVLVVHPFNKTIEKQYKKRSLLFSNNILPEFELKTIKAVQSIAGEKTDFDDWFEALEFMKSEIDKVEYDICLIGCGAYGFPLAAHVKRAGKKGFHIGGSLQLLFGIRGNRWEHLDYHPDYNYANLINEHWVRPSFDEKPALSHIVENECYW